MSQRRLVARIAVSLVALTLGLPLVGCAPGGRGNTNPDLSTDGNVALIPPSEDLGGKTDMAKKNDLSTPDDGSVNPNCTQIASWANVEPAGGYDDGGGVTIAVSADQVAEPHNILFVEDWHTATGYPKSVTFASTDTYETCDVCVRMFEGVTGSSAQALFFAQAGSMTVTQADQDPDNGSMIVSGTNVQLVEWDDGNDAPAPGGRCYEIGSLSMNVSWSTPQDGGSDMAPVDMAGAPCHLVVNEVQTAGVTAADEFVELYNGCGTAVTLTDWRIVYRSRNNNQGNIDSLVFKFPSGASIGAGQYLVVGGTGFQGTKDYTISGSGFSATGGALGLRNAIGTLIDSVSWDVLTTPNDLTEGTPASNPAAGESIARLPNGDDTNDNSYDFDIDATPTPGAANN